jgi:hypothetical protein
MTTPVVGIGLAVIAVAGGLVTVGAAGDVDIGATATIVPGMLLGSPDDCPMESVRTNVVGRVDRPRFHAVGRLSK